MLRLSSLLVFISILTGCASSKTLCSTVPECTVTMGKEECYNVKRCETFEPYGLFDQEKRNQRVTYSIVAGNVFWSIFGFESGVLPIVLCGWYLYEPEGWKVTNE